MNGSRSYQVIDSSYLRSVVIKCALIFIAGLLITAAIFFLIMRQPLGPTYGDSFRMLAQLEQDVFYKSLVIYGSTVLLSLICIVAITVLYSHRVAGPIYRLTLFARQVSGGDLRDGVTLRQNDVIHPLALEMNQMVEKFHRTVGDINREIGALEDQTVRLADQQEGASGGFDKIGEGAGRISSILSQYKL